MVESAKGSRLRALLMMATSTGLRASELRGLRWSDVDLKPASCMCASVRTAGTRSARPRARRVGAPYRSALHSRWRSRSGSSHARRASTISSSRLQRRNIDHHKNMLRSLGPVMKAAGVVKKAGSPKYALHSLRHFFASWCINPADRGGRELPAKVVQTLLGHSSIMMTLDVYGHLFRDGSDRAGACGVGEGAVRLRRCGAYADDPSNRIPPACLPSQSAKTKLRSIVGRHVAGPDFLREG